MNEVELNEFRISRLVDAVNHVSRGNKTDFGRRLGYKDGAFVRQMLSGIRPVTEKTIWAIEAMPGMSGWFDAAASIDDAARTAQASTPLTWPFATISEAQVRGLSPAKLSALEGALALAIAQLNLGIEVAPRHAPAQPPSRGSVVDMDAAADEFPMRIGGASPPWEPDAAPARVAPRPVARAAEVVTNVAPAEPQAANDKFEKVPELGDVRLAAGEGIENHTEQQTGFVQFRRSFLQSVGADGGRGRVVYAKGDSMEPVIRDGATLLVVLDESLTVRNLAADGIYAINYDGKMIVKTIAKDRLTGKWMARSLNPKHPDVSLENGVQVRVLGRIVWAGVQLT